MTEDSRIASWLDATAVYREPRVIALVFLGFSSGLPFGVLAEPLTAWLFESGVSKTEIGLFALVSTPYALKFLWAPLSASGNPLENPMKKMATIRGSR